MRVAYIMSRFPRLTETFILTEILSVQEQGVDVDVDVDVDVELYPILRENATLVQPEAVPLVRSAHYEPFLSAAILRSNLRMLKRRPRQYLRTLAAAIRTTWGSWNFLAGGLAIFPKTVHNALAMQRAGIDHVHCHFANHPALAGFLIHRLVGIPYSFTAHGSDLHKDRHGLAAKVREAAFVVAISEYNRRLIVAECHGRWAAKVDVIHCGVRTDRFQPLRERAPDPDRALSILCIGTLHEVKGQEYLIEACRILVTQGMKLRCLFVGDGEDRISLERQITSADLNETVRLLGARTQPEVAELLAQADVLVAPSVPTASGKREGIPVVLMEAMSSGVPVVASDLSGIPELVVHNETGLLTPPRDADAIARALERLSADPALRRTLAVRARDKILREFDVRSNAITLAARFVASARANS